ILHIRSAGALSVHLQSPRLAGHDRPGRRQRIGKTRSPERSAPHPTSRVRTDRHCISPSHPGSEKGPLSMNDATFRTTDLLDNLLTRRKALKLLGAAVIATASLPQTIALAHQGEHEDASPAASRAPGPREDGSMLWSVQVGGMDMDNAIDFHAFFPREITINAGDGILFNFAPMGRPQFHTVTFTSGEELPPLFVPDMADGTPVV